MNEKQRLLDDNHHEKKQTSIRFHQLFRYGDVTDGVILFFGVCACLIHGICFGLYLLLFGRLTGMFGIQSFVDHCLNGQQNSLMNLSKYIHWLLSISTIQLIAASLRHFLFELTAKRQTNRIRIRLFQAILQRNICYFDKHSIGELNAKLFDNIDKINSVIGFDLSTMIQLITSMLTIIVIGLLINWKLTLIMICFIPFVIVTVHLFAKLTMREAIKEFIAYSKAGQIVQEVFSSLRTVLSLNASQFEQKRYANELDASYWNSIRKGVALGTFIGWLYFTTYLIYAFTFIFGVVFMHAEERDKSMISDIIVIGICFGQCISLVGLIGPFLQTYGEAQAAAKPVFELIDETAEESNVIERENELVVDGDIRFDNVNFVYPSRQDSSILQNLSLVARAGETTALIGPSGSGKSTCMSLLLRYYEPSSGQITINGRCLTDYNVEQVRSHIGIVSQEPILFNTTIYENIRYGKQNATRNEIEEAAKQANAHHFIMQLPSKYETLVGESGVQLSGGEKQRIALARALVKQPTLLLLDEATSALDNTSQQIVQEALDRACKGRTTIVIAHRLCTIRNAHRIYLLSNGTVIEQGTHDTLMAQKQSKYQQMINATQIDDNDPPQVNRLQIDDEDDDDDDKQSLVEDTHLLHNEQTVSEAQPSRNRSTFLRLLAMNRPEWMIILVGCIICIAIGMTQPLFAILLSRIVNAFQGCTYDEQRRQVIQLSILFLLLGLFCIVLRLFQFGAFSMSGWQLTKRVRLRAFESLLRQEIGYFDRSENSCGAISGRLSLDAMSVQQMIGTRLGIVFEALAMLIFGLILGYLFNWKLTSVFFLFVLFVFILVFFDIRCQAQMNTQNSLILARSNSLVVEAIYNIRTVKQFLLEKEFLRQYTELIHKSYLIRRKYSSITAVIFGVYWSSVLYQTTAIYWLTLILVQRNEFKLQDVIYVFAFASFFSQSIRVISSLSKEMGASVSAARSLFELFDRIPLIDNGSTKGQELIDFRGEIQFNQVKFAYPSRPTTCVLDRFQLTIKPGQCVAIVGASGCGKSTLIQILERFYDVIDGQILIDGVNIRQLNLYWIRSRLGLVAQEPVLFDLTIAQNIAYGLENISEEQIRDAAIKANIHEFIQMLPNGYETKVGPKGNQISGGEKQRIAIARVLLRQPKILLLDEATSAMDSYNEQMIQQSLEQAQIEDSTRTSIVIAHRLSTIRSCDVIVVLDRGSIAETGTHTQLIQRRGLYYQMFFNNI